MLARHLVRVIGVQGFLLATIAAPLRAAEETYDLLSDQVYVQRESGPLKADVYVPHGDGQFPGMIVVHGGAWATGTKQQLAGIAQGLAKQGYTTAAISYRLAPQDKFPAQVYDCQAAVRWLRENAARFKLDPDRIGGYGYSAGGHLVAMLGALDDDDFREPGLTDDVPSARLQVVVAGGAPCDFRMLPGDSERLSYWLGGTPDQKPAAYRDASPANYISADDPPMYFFHGAADDIVPIRSPQRMVEKLKQAGVTVELREIPEVGHMGAITDRDTMLEALAFVNRNLRDAPVQVAEGRPADANEGEAVHGE